MAPSGKTTRNPGLNLAKLRRQIARNPVVIKDLRGRMRGGRSFLIVSAYLALLSLAVGVILITFLASGQNNPSVDLRQTLGKSIFGLVVILQLLTMCFIAPALTSGAISAEREHQTFDLIRTTLLQARTLVSGKLFSAVFFLWLLLFTALPLQSLALLFGGVALEEVLIAIISLLVTAFAFSSLGLFFSSLVKRTLISTVLSYATALLLVFGIPLFLILSIGLYESFFAVSFSQPGLAFQGVLLAAGWFFISLNPIAAAVATEVILIEEQSAFFALVPLANGNNFYFISPWIGYTALYFALGLVLTWISVRLVQRVDR